MTNPAQKSLLEQMHIDGVEIARRKDLLGFTQEDADLLARAHSFISLELDKIVDTFYQQQTTIEEIALIIGDNETLRRLYISQKKYINDLFSGFYDENYVNHRLRIGLVHKRIGVEPKYYLSAIQVLKNILRKVIEANIDHPDTKLATLEALDKIFLFDIEFVFDIYIRSLVSEIEAAKDKAVQYAAILEEKVAARTRELELISRTDSLTNILNRRAFHDELRKELARAQRQSIKISLIYFDIDDFKKLNDTEGHYRGDEVLRTIGRVLLEIRRETDIIARYGGDEFCVVLPDTDLEGARKFCDRLTESLRQTKTCEHFTLSIGIVETGPEHYVEVNDFIKEADRLMYETKQKHHSQI